MVYTNFMDKNLLQLHSQFFELIKLSEQLEQSPRTYGTNTLLTHSQIHLIEVIGMHPDLSVTDIAKKLNITKGAVSQQLKRMEAMGMVAKEVDPNN